MIIEKHISFRRLLGVIYKRILRMLAVATIIIFPMIYFDLGRFALDMTTPLVIGTAIAIFLGFRTNSAYDRWFKGRDAWGAIRAESRHLGMLMSRLDEKYINRKTGKASTKAKGAMERIIRRNIAWAWVLGRQLKDLPPFEGIEDIVPKEDYEASKDTHNPALKLLFMQYKDFHIAQSEGQFFDGEHFEFVAIQRNLISMQNMCEGLKSTPFPTHYSFFTQIFIWIFVILLAFSMPGVEKISYFAIPGVVLIGWIFFMVDGIGSYMEEPFNNNRNVVPMDSLARTLERDLKAFALGEETIPDMIEPEEGAIY